MNNGDRFNELPKELDGCKWDAALLSETWRHEKKEIWESNCGHMYMDAGGFNQKHGIGILLEKRGSEKS